MWKKLVSTNKIYKGFSKNGHEHILEEYFDIYLGWYSYYDLENKMWFDANRVDFATLCCIQVLDGFGKRKQRRKVLKSYLLRRNQIIDIKNLVYGDIIAKPYLGAKIEREILLEKCDNLYKRFNESELIPKYYEGTHEEGPQVIYTHEFNIEEPVTKRKVLEYDYKKRKGLI